jgi:hypothetical protein
MNDVKHISGGRKLNAPKKVDVALADGEQRLERNGFWCELNLLLDEARDFKVRESLNFGQSRWTQGLL